ncbi:MAG: MFS transporter [Pseudomonadota bacterium]
MDVADTAAAERGRAQPHGEVNLPAWRFGLLLSAALAVTMAYGVTLPSVPGLVERLQPQTGLDVARHTGWLTAVYTLGLFLFSPVWGALSDRIDRRAVIALGLLGGGAALWGLEGARSLGALYLARGAAGALSAAVLPAVFSYIVEVSVPGRRQKRFAWVASATALGFLLGPVAGNALKALASSPFVAVALVSFAAAACMVLLPPCPMRADSPAGGPAIDEARIRHSLMMTALVVLGITVAEVGLTLLSRASPVIAPSHVAGYFALCSVVMVAVQMWLYPALERWLGEPRLLAAALTGMALGLALLAWPVARWVLAVSFVLGASGIGVLIPALAVRISVVAGARQGWALGRQASAANLGQAVGAAATGMLYAQAPALPFLAAAAMLAGAAWTARPRPHATDSGAR